jgi:hypothetical protein
LALEAYARNMPKSLPAKVVRVDTAKRAVDCKILVMRPFVDEEDARKVESIPVMPNVPLMLPPFYTAPISDGKVTFGGSRLAATTGMLVFCDRSIDRWLSGSGQEVDPELDHDHALTDCWFMPGLFPFGAVPFALSQSKISIGAASTGNIEIDSSGNINLDSGSNGAARVGDPCQIGNPLALWMSQVETAINLIAGGSVTPLSTTFLTTPGVTIKTGSTKVKIG